MTLILLSIVPIVFLAGIAVGYFIGIKRVLKPKEEVYGKGLSELVRQIDDANKLKILRKSEPKTHAEKQAEALDKDKPIIKTFYK